ncbi:MAG: AAA family ATPase [Verrucomicrobia bacterium]|nr:AAA family ATPase [Verrucomicrobiota bacterium]
MKRIVITGAESTGKTTLALSLANHFKAPLSTEFVRSYVSEIKRPIEASDLESIAKGQQTLEDASLNDTEAGLVFHDTNLLSTLIYGEYYYRNNLDWLVEQFLARHYDHYLLCMPDIPWVPDPGQRESPAARDCLHSKFLMRLKQLNLPFTCIQGTADDRLRIAIACVATLVA